MEKFSLKSLALYQLLVYLSLKYIVMAKNTSILLGDHFENFISKEVSSGKYGSASEVVRTALRMLESEEEKIRKRAVAEGFSMERLMIKDNWMSFSLKNQRLQGEITQV